MQQIQYFGDLTYLKESPVPHLFNTTVMDYVSLTHSESARFWATKSRGEPVSPLVSLPLPQALTPANLPPSYHHLPTMSSTTTLASIPPSYNHLPTMSSTIPASLPHPFYQHLPTITASYLSSQTMPYYPTDIVHTHLSIPYVIIISNCYSYLSTMPSTTHFYTAELKTNL
ncbi:unnamed protein product [Mytilus coruscus]|uniref:Uncharacterized protein n=1 Tax=Mytilus coruscus TaxID=42192 RepID=A0A6J8A981_MYTCO|nr:unnamed protein product [Mytilus coruscus]